MVDRGLLESYLHANIPLSAAMGVEVHEWTDKAVTLKAPLAPNINHHRTAFGGSISTIATLAAWSYVHSCLRLRNVTASLVIQRHEIDYRLPITGDFMAKNREVSKADLDTFFARLSKRGRARLTVESEVRFEDLLCAAFTGQFVAMRESGQD